MNEKTGLVALSCRITDANSNVDRLFCQTWIRACSEQISDEYLLHSLFSPASIDSALCKLDFRWSSLRVYWHCFILIDFCFIKNEIPSITINETDLWYSVAENMSWRSIHIDSNLVIDKEIATPRRSYLNKFFFGKT